MGAVGDGFDEGIAVFQSAGRGVESAAAHSRGRGAQESALTCTAASASEGRARTGSVSVRAECPARRRGSVSAAGTVAFRPIISGAGALAGWTPVGQMGS